MTEQSDYTVPISVAAIGAAGVLASAVLTYMSNSHELALERLKAEHGLIMEAIGTDDPDQAAENLRFLLEVGLLPENPKMEDYLNDRPPGKGRATG